jgi:hypothetical protein
MAFARGSNPRGVACEIVACLVGMVLGVQLARLIAVVLRMEVVRMGVVGGLFVMAGRMRRGCCVMVRGVVLVMVDLLLVGHVICG